MSGKYSFPDYDKNLVLKPNIEIWAVILYFLLPFILKISTMQMGRGLKNENVKLLKEAFYPDNFSFFIAILAAIPTIAVIIAFSKRKPNATDFSKKLWRNGKNFLIASAVLNIITIFVPLAMHTFNDVNTLGWVKLGIDVVIIIFLSTSQRVKDTFADFPEDTDKKKK